MIFRSKRTNAAFCHDLVMAGLSFLLSFYLRVGDTLGEYSWRLITVYDLSFVVIAGAVFWWTGLYRGIWRYASLPDMLALLRATTIVMLLFFPAMFILTRLDQLPRSMPFINWLVLMALLGGPRFAYRAYKDRGLGHVLERADRSHSIPVLLIGARDGAAMFIREMASDPDRLYRVVGIIADSSSRVGRDIAGVPVLGTIDDVPQVIAALDERGERPQRMIISAQSLDGAVVRRLLDAAEALTIPLARLPRLTEFKATGAEEPSIEPVAIEDLLGRPQAVLDRAGMQALIAGRRVLVTGAGGTIGSELVRQIAAYVPARLALVDNSEFALYTIDRELEERHAALPRQALIGDVRDRSRIEEIIAAERPELVFHAAALKHVPMVEANPIEGVLTNTLGTRFVAEACRAHGVRAMVMISTDKAVNPANVMGASKRLAESICQALDVLESRKAEGTRFVTVRFGNVLGSTGSVVPLFQRQLAAGGPLTVTHPSVQRYFMTVREAVELVLEASALAMTGREQRGRIFVLDMGEPVKIVDLARQMIRLAGKKPDIDVKIEFIGLRPGEKLYEELFYPNEPLVPTAAAGIRLAAPRIIDYAMLQRSLDELAEHARERRQERLLALLATLVPEFAASAGGATRAAEA